MRKPVAALPDIDDETFKARLQPLARVVLPPEPGSGARLSGTPDSRDAGLQARPQPTRSPKRGVEFLLPEHLVVALKTEALQRGTSMSVRLLEILRDAGYKVTDQDFVDLRKLPRR